MIFYQTTSALFLGLLVAVLLRAELLDGRPDEKRASTASGRRRAALIAFVSLAMAIGEFASLLVLFSAHATGLAHDVVGITALIALVGIMPPAMLAVITRVLGAEAVHLWLRRAAWSSAAILGISAPFVADHLGVLASGPVPSGSLNTPRQYQVFGTCAAGACGLNERAAPTPHAKKLGQLQDGSPIGVICQVIGYPLRTNDRTSRIWDQLADASYVSDLFVSTPHSGSFSPELTKCPRQAITSGTQG